MEKILAEIPDFLGLMETEFRDIGFQAEMVIEELRVETRQHMARSIASGLKAGEKLVGTAAGT